MATTADLEITSSGPTQGSELLHLNEGFSPEERQAAIPTYLIEPTTIVRRWWRSFSRPSRGNCAVHGSWGHDIWVPIDELDIGGDPNSALPIQSDTNKHQLPHSAQLPIQCVCGHRFDKFDFSGIYQRRLYRAAHAAMQSIGMFCLDEAPAGAVYFLDWQDVFKGPDGHCIAVMTPAGPWGIDMPDIYGQEWKRNPILHIGQDVILSVQPGVRIGKYRGALEDGLLIPKFGK
jgi:hypothetical protein